MATTNPVSQVLVTVGNLAPKAVGNRMDSLAIGQIGVFNFHTGLSVDATSPASDLQDIFLAVGIDPDNIGSIQDVNKSAGQVIQARNSRNITVKGYVAALPKIVDVYGFLASCQTDYNLRVELRNPEIYGLFGYNMFTKNFTYTTGCCADQCSNGCGTGDPIELATGIFNAIVADPDQLITVQYIQNAIKATVNAAATATGSLTVTIGATVYTVPITTGDTVATVAGKIVAVVNTQVGSPYTGVATAAVMAFFLKGESPNAAGTDTFALTAAGGTGVTVNTIVVQTKTVVADPVAFKTSYPGALLGLRLTSVPSAIYNYASINLKYKKPRSTDLIVSLNYGFECSGTATIIQNLQYTEGSGYDVKQQEYMAGGWNGRPGPYRVSTVLGLERDGFLYFANPATNYNQVVFQYDQFSVGGWLEYLNNLETVVAIPCADTVTLLGLIAITDVVFANRFGAMTNDVTGMACNNAQVHTLTPATDGIESLS